MPKLLEPKQRFAVVLDTDKDKPSEVQPTFWCLAVSAREGIALLNEIKEITANENADDEAFNILEKHVVDWSNMIPATGDPIQFDLSKLRDILTTSEAWELLRLIRNNNHLSVDEKKAKGSGSDSAR